MIAMKKISIGFRRHFTRLARAGAATALRALSRDRRSISVVTLRPGAEAGRTQGDGERTTTVQPRRTIAEQRDAVARAMWFALANPDSATDTDPADADPRANGGEPPCTAAGFELTRVQAGRTDH